MSQRVLKTSAVLLVLISLVAGASQILAGKPGGGGCPTPRIGCVCYEIYAPVVCDGGCTYSNQCFANCAGAKNCVPSGPGPVQ